jgi:hypothetical protein
MTTSLYGTSTTAGEVASTNFTTLYSNTTQSVPVQVSGNTTYEIASQATTGGANLLLTGSDGSTDTVKYQSGVGIAVSSTDGSTILITNTSPAGTTYNIDATAAIGGANLNLYGSDSTLDSVKFAGGSNVTVTRTDASTITISSAADDIPDGTGKGQVLYWDGTAWTANSTITFDASIYRPRFVNNVNPGTTAVDFLKQYTGTLLDATTVGTLFGFYDGGALSSTNPRYTHRITSEYDTTGNPIYRVQVDPVGNFNTGSTTLVTTMRVDNDYLGITGNRLLLNKDVTAAPTENAIIEVGRGTSTDATITWDETDDRWESNFDFLATGLQGGNIQIAMGGLSDNEIYIGGNDLLLNTASGLNNIQSNSPIQTTAQSMSINSDNTAANSQLNFKGTTQYLKWNNTNVEFELSNGIEIGGNTYVNGDISQTGQNLTINSDNTAADSYLYLKGTTEYLKWNNTDTRFEFSDQIYNSQTETPAILEVRAITADINTSLEWKSALRLSQRVTDAPNNNTTAAGPGITFSRTSGATDSTSKIFAGMGAVWDGSTGLVNWAFNWTDDNYAEPTPGNFPGTYQLLRMGSNSAEFNNESLFVNYAAQGTTHTATSITGGNTLVFGSAHGYTAGKRIQYTSTTQNGLTQNIYYYVMTAGLTSTQCQVSLTRNGSAVALTNGTGLTLNFADLINQVGVNTDTPAYTLDVNGELNVASVLTVQADAITINSDKTDQDVYVNFGRVAPNNNAAIRWNKTTNSFEWSEDSSTWHDFIDATITNPQQGQFLTYDAASTEWINSSLIQFNSTTYRPNFQSDQGTYGRTQSGAIVSNNTGAVAYTTADGGSMLMGVQSDSQSLNTFGSISTAYNTTGDHEIRLSTSTNSFTNDKITSITGGNTLVFSAAHGFTIGDRLTYASPTVNGLVYGTTYYVIASGFTTTQCQISLTLGGSAVALTNGTGLSLYMYNGTSRLITATNASVEINAPTLMFNATNTGIPGVNAGIEVERGTSGANSTFIWSETNDRWEASEDFFVQKATIGFIDIDRTDGQIDTNSGYNLTLDSDGGTVLINDNLNVDSGVLYVDSVGNEVGINTLTPAYPLDVNGIINTNDAVQCDFLTVDSQATLDSNTLTTTSTATVALNGTARNAMTGLVNIKQGTNVHCVNYTALRIDSTTAMITTYGEMYNTSVLANFSADVSGGLLRLLITPTSATSTVFSAVRTSLT